MQSSPALELNPRKVIKIPKTMLIYPVTMKTLIS